MDPRVSQTAAARAALEGGHPRHPVPPMPWADRAACRGMTAVMFPHAGDHDGIAAAKRVCVPPVRCGPSALITLPATSSVPSLTVCGQVGQRRNDSPPAAPGDASTGSHGTDRRRSHDQI